jgi:hypothetical protein
MNDRTFDGITRGLAGTTSRRQALKLLGGGIAAGALGTAAVSSVTAAPPSAGGTALSGTTLVTDLVATFDRVTGDLTVSGLLGGTTEFSEVLNIAGSAAGSSCDILFLDLLGLEIEITAVPGAGNLLGNLLCAVAGLLDRGGPLQGLTNLLNQIFGLLG